MNKIEKKTFSLHLIYSVIDGCIKGCFIMNEFIFLRSIKGGEYQLGILFQFSMLLLLLAVVFNELLKRSKRKKRLLLGTAVVSHFPLLLTWFFPQEASPYMGSLIYQIFFLAVFFMYYLSTPLVLPTINLLLKNTYSHNNFGKFYSIASAVGRVCMLMATFSFGFLLDIDNYAFRYVYPTLAILGITGISLLTAIPYTTETVDTGKSGFWLSVKASISRMVNILKKNKPFTDFQVGFMLYGFAFMSTSAVITIFLESYLHLNYSSVAFYKNIFNVLAVVLMPICGRFLAKIEPRKFAIITFSSLALYIFFVGATEFFPAHFTYMGLEIYYMLLIAMFCFGIFTATMPLLWNIGSAYFCESRDAGDYQSIHLSMTGVRAAFAPIVGIFFYQISGFIGTWTVAILSLMAAVLLMIYSYKKRAHKVV